MQSSECIPKYGAEKGSGVRPISLVGSLYKIIKKMTTNRIEEVTVHYWPLSRSLDDNSMSSWWQMNASRAMSGNFGLDCKIDMKNDSNHED